VRVLQVTYQPGGTGSAISTLHLSIGLKAKGVDVRLACPPDSELERLARKAGVPVHAAPFGRRDPRPNARMLEQIIAANPVDLVNAQSVRDRQALVWSRLWNRLDIPLVITRRQMPQSLWLENWLSARAAAKVIAVSPAVAAELARRGTPAEKIAVVPNGVVLDRLDRTVSDAELDDWRRRIGWEPGRKTVVIVSRPKAQDAVLNALALVATPLRVVLAGAGVSSFEAEVQAVPARHAVVRLDFDSNHRIRPAGQRLRHQGSDERPPGPSGSAGPLGDRNRRTPVGSSHPHHHGSRRPAYRQGGVLAGSHNRSDACRV
jgi:glycosyltransferase involved in cell wall biosynthesis